MIKRFLIWLLTVISIILAGTFLVSFVHIIDSPQIAENLRESGRVLALEEVYQKTDFTKTSTLDNYTDSLMLLIASYSGDEPLLEKGMNNYRVYKEGFSPYEQLTDESIKAETRVISYYRYWHRIYGILKTAFDCF